MITQKDLGQRLRQAREDAGIKQEDVALTLGLDTTAITKIERGKRGLGALELMQLLSLYKVSIDDLFEDVSERSEVQLRIAMHTGVVLDPKITSLMQRRLQQIISDNRWLQCKLETLNIPNMPSLYKNTTHKLPSADTAYENGYQAAVKFREKHGLAAAPIVNMEILSDEVGILVCRLPLGNYQAPDGCCAVDPLDDTAYILINSDKPRARRRFTIAHELGHLELGHLHRGEIILDETTTSTQPQETEANAFAAELLMPGQGVKATLERLRNRLGSQTSPLELAVWLAASFGVSEEAVSYRLLNLGLTSSVAGDMVEAIKATREKPEIIKQVRVRLGLTSVMPDTERGIIEVGPTMRARIALALENGIMSIQRAAEMMYIPIQDTYRWIIETGLAVERKS